MAGSALAAAAANSSVSVDPALQACNAWQAFHAECDGLIKRWQTLESYLIRQHNWRRLSRRQRAAIPEAFVLDAIDDRLDDIHDQQQQLLASLPLIYATTPRGIAAKLAVVASVVHREENAEAHELIVSVLADFRTLARITAQ
ncbi:MAG: hypothetical protein EON61_02955 [Alphaproteobacteria bacterium]|nr:MAG: hypothetical protein EON61_02955 [Alphaproteobacteria bacterium]